MFSSLVKTSSIRVPTKCAKNVSKVFLKGTRHKSNRWITRGDAENSCLTRKIDDQLSVLKCQLGCLLTNANAVIVSAIGFSIDRVNTFLEKWFKRRFSNVCVVAIDGIGQLSIEMTRRSSQCSLHSYFFFDDIIEHRNGLSGFGFRWFGVVQQRNEEWLQILSFLNEATI